MANDSEVNIGTKVDESDLEFYKCAEKLQDDITDFCLRGFDI